MRKTYKYRIYPTRTQTRLLCSALEECRWLYNHFLAERKDAWADSKKAIGLYDQDATLKTLKKSRPSLKAIYSQIAQNVIVRVDLAFKAFFRRCKLGTTPGYPRFKGQGHYDSFTYPQANGSFKFVDECFFRLAKIGNVRVAKHRELEGIPKSCIVKRAPTGKWFVSISCDDIPTCLLPKNNSQIGIDVGLASFATFSDGTKVDNPRFLKQEKRVH